MQPDPTEVLEKCLSILAEHYDAVQIVATNLIPSGKTSSIHRGCGNWYARKALCEEFIERDQAETLALEIKKQSPDQS